MWIKNRVHANRKPKRKLWIIKNIRRKKNKSVLYSIEKNWRYFCFVDIRYTIFDVIYGNLLMFWKFCSRIFQPTPLFRQSLRGNPTTFRINECSKQKRTTSITHHNVHMHTKTTTTTRITIFEISRDFFHWLKKNFVKNII